MSMGQCRHWNAPLILGEVEGSGPTPGSGITLLCEESGSTLAAALRRFDRMRFDLHAQRLAEGAEDGGEVVHAGIAVLREHAMKTFGRQCGRRRQSFESDRGIHEVTQDGPGGARL